MSTDLRVVGPVQKKTVDKQKEADWQAVTKTASKPAAGNVLVATPHSAAQLGKGKTPMSQFSDADIKKLYHDFLFRVPSGQEVQDFKAQGDTKVKFWIHGTKTELEQRKADTQKLLSDPRYDKEQVKKAVGDYAGAIDWLGSYTKTFAENKGGLLNKLSSITGVKEFERAADEWIPNELKGALSIVPGSSYLSALEKDWNTEAVKSGSKLFGLKPEEIQKEQAVGNTLGKIALAAFAPEFLPLVNTAENLSAYAEGRKSGKEAFIDFGTQTITDMMAPGVYGQFTSQFAGSLLKGQDMGTAFEESAWGTVQAQTGGAGTLVRGVVDKDYFERSGGWFGVGLQAGSEAGLAYAAQYHQKGENSAPGFGTAWVTQVKGQLRQIGSPLNNEKSQWFNREALKTTEYKFKDVFGGNTRFAEMDNPLDIRTATQNSSLATRKQRDVLTVYANKLDVASQVGQQPGGQKAASILREDAYSMMDRSGFKFLQGGYKDNEQDLITWRDPRPHPLSIFSAVLNPNYLPGVPGGDKNTFERWTNYYNEATNPEGIYYSGGSLSGYNTRRRIGRGL